MISSPVFTIFTPAYNRPQMLQRACESLAAQSFADFEWIIVDDGSGPEVRAAVEQIQARAAFPVRYFWQPNQGKHVAHNRAIREARGLYFAVLDDDDTLLPDALERSLLHWNQIPAEMRAGYVSVVGICTDQDGTLHGRPFPIEGAAPGAWANADGKNWRDGDHLEMVFRWGAHHERWGTHRTAVLKRYPYPAPAGPVSYMVEDVLFFRTARGYRTRYVNEVWRIWQRGHGTVTTHISTRLRDFQRIAPTQKVVRRLRLVEFTDLMRTAPRFVLESACQYTRFSLHNGDALRAQWRDLPWFWPRLLWLLTLPAGVALWLRDLARLRLARRQTGDVAAYRVVDQQTASSAQLEPPRGESE